MTTDVLHDLRVRSVIERNDPGLALRIEAVRPIGFCDCHGVLRARDVDGCLVCGGRLRRPWRRRP